MTTTDSVALADVNVLLALTHAGHEFHEPARRWFAGGGRFATTPVTELGLVRLLMNPAVTGEPIGAAAALAALGALRGHERAVFWPDDSSLADATVDPLAIIGHRQATDLHLIHLALRNGGVLASFDQRLWRALPDAYRAGLRIIDV